MSLLTPFASLQKHSQLEIPHNGEARSSANSCTEQQNENYPHIRFHGFNCKKITYFLLIGGEHFQYSHPE